MVRNLLRGLVIASLVLVLMAWQGAPAEAVTHITRTAVIANDSSGISAMATQGGQKLFEDAFGKTIAVYIDGVGRIGITYANSNPTIASSWATPVKSSAPLAGYSRPAVVLASSNSLRIIAEGGSGAGHIIDMPVTISRDAQNNIIGLSFGTRVSLDTSGGANYPSAVLAHNGNILAIWWQNATTSSLVKSFRWISGTGWRGFGGSSLVPDDAIVDTSDLDIIFPSLIQRGDNRHVYLFGNRAESSPNRLLVFNKATFGGTNWSWGTQNLAYETGVARGPFDVPSAVWDPGRQLVVVAHDLSGFQKYSVFTLTSSDVKTHLDTPDLAINNNEWGNVEVYEPTGEYYIFMIDSVDQVVNHDNGRIGYIRYNGISWESSLTIIDPDVQNVGISMRKTGSNSTMDFLYTDTSGGSPNLLKFVRTLQVPNATTVVFTATEDASVIADQPTTNFGSAAILEVDSGPVAKHTFLRFQITGLPSHQPIEARLRIFSAGTSGASSNRGGDFYTTSNAWNESTVTWNNAPANNPGLIAALGAVSSSTWNELDITPTITGNGPLNIKIIPASSDGADYSSSEGTNPPELVVTFSNAAPILSSIGNKSVSEETLLTFTATATDADNDPLTFSLAPGAPVGATITTGGVFSWTPTENQGPGNYPATIVVSDGALTDTETITLTVNEVNRAPVLTVPGPQLVQEGSLLSFTVTATDPDIPANSITFSATGMPSGASLNPTTGVFSWTPTLAQGPGDYTISFTATDNGSPPRSDTKTVAIHVNEPPIIGTIANKVVGEETLLSFKVNATDADLPTQTLTYTLLAGAPSGTSINPSTGMFAWTPTESQGPGTYSVTVSVSDGSGGTSTRTFSITVTEANRPPVLTVLGAQTLSEEGSVSFGVSATDPDLPPNTLTLSASGLPNGANFNPLTGLFSWTTTEAQGPGVYTVTFTATDNGSPQLSDSKTVTITVNEVNQPPELAPIGNKALNEETVLTFTATATDLDVPPNALTFSLGVGAPSGASITSAGALSWTPSEVQGPGSYTVTIIVSDGSLTDSETITVTVNEANKPPVLNTIGPRNVVEQTVLAFSATATDADVPVQTLAFSLTSAPTGSFPTGAVITPQGAFSWTPSESQGPGPYKVRILVSDGVVSSFEDVTITVTEANLPPVLNPIGNKVIAEQTPLAFTATATDPDVPANTLTFSLGPGAPSGTSINPTTGSFAWTPTEAQGPGVYTVRIIVSDGLASTFEDVQVTVNEVNRPPVIATIDNRNTNEETVVTFNVNASDPDIPVQTLTLSLVGGPGGSAINPATGAFTWTPSESQGPGTYTLTVVVTDGSGASAQQSFTITVVEVNRTPTLAVPGTQTVEEGTLLTFSISVTDPDIPANTVTLSASGTPSGSSFNPATGAFNWTPSESQGKGQYLVTFTATDNGSPSLSDVRTVTISVNEHSEPPTLSLIGTRNIDEQTLLTFTATATDPDIPSSPLMFSLGAGAPAGTSIDPATGVFMWTPTESQGPSNFVVRIVVSDGSLTDFEDVSISVNEVNRPPTLAPVNDVSVNEGTLVAFTIQASDPDTPANLITLSSLGLPTGASFDSATGAFSWIPSEQQGPAQLSISFTATDNGAPPMSVTITVSIIVLETNRPPELGSIGNRIIDEGALLAFGATATDPDIPANSVTFSLGPGAPAGAAITPGGLFTWTPTESQGPSTYVVRFVVSDGLESDFEDVTIAVNEVNMPATIAPIGDFTIDEETAFTFTILPNDSDIPANTLTLSHNGLPPGAAFNPATGVFSWTPSEAQGPGTYSITFAVTDDGSPSLQTNLTVTITVREVNQTPVLDSLEDRTVDEETVLVFTVNASDADLPANNLTFSLAPGLPSGAAIGPVTGLFTWAVAEFQGPGTYSITVIVSDESGASASQSFLVTVNETNRPPVLQVPGGQSVDEASLLTFTVSASDPDIPANMITLSALSLPAGASFDTITGIFSWTPNATQEPGTYIVSFTATDNGVPSLFDTRPVSINVVQVNTDPALDPIGPKAVDEETALTFTATATDTDQPVQELTFSLVNPPPSASIDPATGVFSWTPTEQQGPGAFLVTILVSDGYLSDDRTITIMVLETNRAPMLDVPSDQTVDEESPVTFSVSATDSDIPANSIALSATGLPAGASFDALTGVFSWTPSEAAGPAVFTIIFTAMDNGTPPLSDSKTVVITVREVNRPPLVESSGAATVSVGTTLKIIVSGDDPDLPSNVLHLSASGLVSGMSFDDANGIFLFTPTSGQAGQSFTISFTALDDGSPPLSGTRTIIVQVVSWALDNSFVFDWADYNNDGTVNILDISFTAICYETAAGVGSTGCNPVSSVYWDFDRDGRTTIIDIATLALIYGSRMTAPYPGRGLTTGQMDSLWDNNCVVLNSAYQAYCLATLANNAPELKPIGNRLVDEENLLTFASTATDADGDTLAFYLQAPGAPEGWAMSSSGVFTWTPTEAQGPGTYQLKIIVSDGLLVDFETITITVNEVP